MNNAYSHAMHAHTWEKKRKLHRGRDRREREVTTEDILFIHIVWLFNAPKLKQQITGSQFKILSKTTLVLTS